MPTTENMGFEDRLGVVSMSELLTALEQQVTILIADKRRLRAALLTISCATPEVFDIEMLAAIANSALNQSE